MTVGFARLSPDATANGNSRERSEARESTLASLDRWPNKKTPVDRPAGVALLGKTQAKRRRAQ